MDIDFSGIGIVGLGGFTLKYMKIGFIVNPIAGVGGSVGWKGSDGIRSPEALIKAISLGAKLVSPAKAKRFLRCLKGVEEVFSLFTAPCEMGGVEAGEVGLKHEVVGEVSGFTTSDDTKRVAREMAEIPVDLLVFVGGDGTARDVYDGLDAKLPIIGVPAGVKMYSAVFSFSPEAAVELTVKFMRGLVSVREAEVMDIDEEAFRDGRISARLYGYAIVPYEASFIQPLKSSTPITDEEVDNKLAIARYIVECMEPDVLYVIGPGSTNKAIGNLLGVDKTLLGVDLIYNKKIVEKDVGERRILELLNGLGGRAKIIITPIGSQGFIFGRGNQQISSKVIRKVGRENIIIAATRHKMMTTPILRVDTGDQALDSSLRGYVKVVIDYNEEAVAKVI